MQIPNIHESIIVMKTIDTRFFGHVFEAVQKTARVLSAPKITRLRLVVLNTIKHSCSFFKHYITVVKSHPDYKIGNIQSLSMFFFLFCKSQVTFC